MLDRSSLRSIRLSPMPPPIISLRHAEDPRDAVHRAVQALAEGKLVAVPTETVYGIAASGLNEQAVNRLSGLKQRRPDSPFTLAVKSAEDALDYVPRPSALAERLARRCWPGPVTLVLDNDHPDSLLQQLPTSVQQSVGVDGTVGLRVPAHDVLLSILRLTAGPLVLASANRPDEREAHTAEEVAQSLGDDLDLILDDGPCKFGQPASVVRVGAEGTQLLRPGVINEQALARLSSYLLVFVCTGNTCRSPMAETLMRHRIAQRLGCEVGELEDRNIMVMSAGLAATAGGRVSPESAQVMQERGLNANGHESQPLSDRLVRFADLVLAMTRGHRDAIITQWPDVASRVRLLCRDNSDVGDPIGGSIELYRRCADQIETQLDQWLDELDASFPSAGASGD